MEVTPEMLAGTEITNEQLFRGMAIRMVKDIPIAELCKLIRFTKTVPTSEAINDPETPEYEREKLIDLRDMGLILYEAEIY